MIDFFMEAKDLMSKKIPLVLAIILKKEGSSPREPGAWMLVTENGLHSGTIGGGILEYKSIEMAKEHIKNEKSSIHTFILNDEEAGNMGMVCGGKNTVGFFCLNPSDKFTYDLLEKVLENYKFHSIDFVVDLKEPNFYISINEGEYSENDLLKKSDLIKFSIEGKKRFLVFGGGHIAKILVPILDMLNFETVVIEDREEFLKEEDFPNSLRLLAEGFSTENIEVTRFDYICILTRGHVFDLKVLMSVLPKNPKYIGVIGSTRKAKRVFDEVEKSGLAEFKNTIYCPVGLDIGAETPEEIALSIASQIISIYRSVR